MVLEIREPSFLVLTALADGPKYGYAIVREVLDLSGGRVRLRAGTLYATLDRLAREGLIVLAGDQVVEGRLRRYYQLTDEGARVLSEQALRMRVQASAAVRRLRRRSAAPVRRVTP